MVVKRFLLAGCVVLLVTTIAFRWLGQFGPSFSSESIEWANFGTYFGGVTGPLLSFLALIAVAWTLEFQQKTLRSQDETLRLQYDMLKRDHEKQEAEQHIRWLDGIYRDILDLLRTTLRSDKGQEPTTLWAVLYGEVDSDWPNPVILKARLEELLKLLNQYCEAVAMYRDNVSEFWDARIFQDRGARILDKMKPLLPIIGINAAMAVEFCDMHLRGESARREPEALKRPTRN